MARLDSLQYSTSLLNVQVVSGGKYDVDCILEDPDGLKLMTWKRKQYEAHEWDAQKTGPYQVSCCAPQVFI